jgi:type II secretory pathway pseudopilin PulG
MKKMKNKSSAFTLIETLIAITLVMVVITATTGLILSTLLSNQRNIHSVQAAFLAQESLEALRFMRDSNWLQNYAWDGGTPLWGGDFALSDGEEVELLLKEEDCPPCFAFTSFTEQATVKLGGNEYIRSVLFKTVLDEEGNRLPGTVEVIAKVAWQERGETRSIEVSTYLSNWQ